MRGMRARLADTLGRPGRSEPSRSAGDLRRFAAAAAAARAGAASGSGCRWRSSPSPAIGILAFRHTVAFCVAWLLLAGATLEMTLADLVGPAAFQTTIAVVKAAGLGLALLCVAALRRHAGRVQSGLRLRGDVRRRPGAWPASRPDPGRQPALAGWVRGSLRLRVQPAVAPAGRDAIVRTTAWVPLISVAGGAVLDLAGSAPVVLRQRRRAAGRAGPSGLSRRASASPRSMPA